MPVSEGERSPLENSSFLVSSANADEILHGRGFVARLSGSRVSHTGEQNRRSHIFRKNQDSL